MLEGQKCLVIGSGISGIGAVAIIGENINADVVLYDSSDKLTGEDLEAKLPEGSQAVCIAGELPENVELSIQAAVLSPGVPTDIPLVNRMRDRGVQISRRDRTGIPCGAGQSDRHYRHQRQDDDHHTHR